MTTLASPYMDDGTWLRGNLHTHTAASDSPRPIEAVLEDYQTRGYDFLAISDHDTFVDPTEYQDDVDLLLVPAVEVSANGPHLLHLGAGEAIEPLADRQRVIDRIAKGGGLAILAHPNWEAHFDHWPQSVLRETTGYAGIEIYNGLVEQHPGAPVATDRWDQLLATGRRIWGFANDDSHRVGDLERGWNVVQVDDRTPSAVFQALSAGRCYGSTGVSIEEIEVINGTVTIGTENADRIRLISDYGVVQQTYDDREATFHVPDDLTHGSEHSYVRVECFGAGNNIAWTQPMFLEA